MQTNINILQVFSKKIIFTSTELEILRTLTNLSNHWLHGAATPW